MRSKISHRVTSIAKLGLLLGCASPVITLAAAGTENKTVTSEVVVIGSSLPTETYKVGNAVTVLEAEDIQQLGYQYASDLLRTVPGLAVSRSGGYGGITEIRIRGAESNHVLVLVDGINVSAAGSGVFDFSTLLSADIERIEVLRGPQSGLYGSNALAGVISIQTKAVGTGFAVSGELEAGSHDTRNGGASVAGGNERVKGRLSVVQHNAEFDISEDDSFGSEDDKDKNTTISGQLNVSVSDALSIDLYGRRADKETDTDGYDFSGGPLQGLTFDNDSGSDTLDESLGATATLDLLDGRSVSRLTLSRAESETDGGTFGNEASRDQVNLNTTWDWGKSDNLAQRSTFFIEHKKERYRNTMPSDPSQAAEQERELLGYGVEHRLDIGEHLFIAGTVRKDNNDDFQDETTYSFNTAYRFVETGTRLHASYGKGVTNPTFFEQFGFTPGRFIGNTDLQPEESTGWDIGIEQGFLNDSLIMDITVFDADLENEIQTAFTPDFLSTVDNDNGESTREGVELSLDYFPSDTTSVRFAYTYTNADENAGAELRRPEHIASLYASTYINEKLSIGGSVIYNGAQLDNDFRNYFTNGFAAERTELDAYTLVNLNAGYDMNPDLHIYARVENLFDEDYEEVIGYATPDRAIYAGVRFNFGS